jgi:predicted Zn-dependent peptidase
MPFHTHILPNGLTILGETNPSAVSVAVCLWVKTGARDETPEVSGVSHFLEHMVFKGTERRNPFAVNRDFSRIGADNNAWTSEENTVFHAVVLPEFLPEVVDVLTDILRPSLREEDFNTEKSVILDEIVRYAVQPGWAIYDQGRRTYFGEHPLGNSILGSEESIKAMTHHQMRTYFDARYTGSNIIAVATGNYDWNQFVELITKACGDWPAGTVVRQNRRETKGAGGTHLIHRPVEKVSQQYVMLMNPCPSNQDPLRYASGVLATAIGDYSGSRLFWALSDTGLADECSMSADLNDAAGAYYLSYNCDPESAEECYQEVQKILQDIQANGLKDDEIQSAKTKIASREVRAAERSHRRMASIATEWAYNGKYISVDDDLKALDAIDGKAIRDLLDRYPLTNPTTITLGPLEKFLDGVKA